MAGSRGKTLLIVGRKLGALRCPCSGVGTLVEIIFTFGDCRVAATT
jgi:hypothetical protein